MTLGATGNPSSQLTTMSLMNNRLAQAAGELLTQRPHRLGHLSSGGLRVGKLLLQAIEPLVKARVEIVAQALPLATCADFG